MSWILRHCSFAIWVYHSTTNNHGPPAPLPRAACQVHWVHHVPAGGSHCHKCIGTRRPKPCHVTKAPVPPFASSGNENFIKNPPRDLGNKWCKTAGGLLFFHAFHLVFTVYLLVLKGRFSIKIGYCFLTTLTVNTEYGEVLGWRRQWSSTEIWTFSERETGETWNMLDSKVGSSVFRMFSAEATDIFSSATSLWSRASYAYQVLVCFIASVGPKRLFQTAQKVQHSDLTRRVWGFQLHKLHQEFMN